MPWCRKSETGPLATATLIRGSKAAAKIVLCPLEAVELTIEGQLGVSKRRAEFEGVAELAGDSLCSADEFGSALRFAFEVEV